ncbi:MAG: hypothetical protein Q4C83_01120 [Candidatus Saccharibacteria bacterium]|nr:hypothetical protein [Candidatus Saccharibacteria bacterium]
MAIVSTLANGDMSVDVGDNGSVLRMRLSSLDDSNCLGNNSNMHLIGVYCEGAIHWLHLGGWDFKFHNYPGKPINHLIAEHKWLKLRLEIVSFVDSELNVLFRNIQVINLSARKRDIKIMLHQAFELESNQQFPHDTAKYIPNGVIKGVNLPTISHCNQQGDKTVLITGKSCQNAKGFDDFCIGRHGTYGNDQLTGSWVDADDGKLSRNPVDTGRTDSMIAFAISLDGHDSCLVNYYLSTAASISEAGRHLHRFLHEGDDLRTKKTAEYWSDWLHPAIDIVRQTAEPEQRYTIVNKLIKIKTNIATSGAVVMGSSKLCSPLYSAHVIRELYQYGLLDDVRRIFGYLANILTTQPHLHPAYRTDGTVVPTDFAYTTRDVQIIYPIRLVDNTSVLIALADILLDHSDNKLSAEWKKLWRTVGIPLANFLSDYIDPLTKLPLPSYQVNTNRLKSSTVDIASTYQALVKAAEVSEMIHDMDGAIKYRTVAEEIYDNCDDELTKLPQLDNTLNELEESEL